MKYLIFLRYYLFLTPAKFLSIVLNNSCLFMKLKKSSPVWEDDPELVLTGILEFYLGLKAPTIDYKLITKICNKLFGSVNKPCVKLFNQTLKELGLI